MTIKTDLTRRSFIKSAAAGAGAVAVPMAVTGCGGDDDDKKLGALTFAHGVASGDPLANSVIIWTRITPQRTDSKDSVEVTWAVSESADMSSPVKTGAETTSATKDFTVKVDITGLDANTTYFYQFNNVSTDASVIGETKTLPEGNVASLKLAVCSCANYPAGYFNVYDKIAESDAEIVLHLGDYIYEYAVGEYGTTANTIDQGRNHSPTKEIWTLADYRQRYAQYRQDSMLQAAHKAKPFICVWDDHELANDSYKDGAANHTEDNEGTFEDRRNAAFQAYHEWLPIRSGNDLSDIYRQFEIGDLVNLQMMDTRQIARDKPVSLTDFPDLLSEDAAKVAAASAAFAGEIGSSSRALLGSTQHDKVVANMKNNTAKWQVFGQQVLMGRILVPAELLVSIDTLTKKIEAGADATEDQAAVNALITELYTLKLRANQSDPTLTDAEKSRINTVLPYNLDSWDGYAYEREMLLIEAVQADKNLVVLAGDTHNAWASELRLLELGGSTVSGIHAGVEFATSSVSSPGFDEYLSLDAASKVGFESAIAALVEDLRFMDANRRGYMTVEFTQTKATAEWIFVSDIVSNENITTDSNYVQLAADGATPVPNKAKFEVLADGPTTASKLTQVV